MTKSKALNVALLARRLHTLEVASEALMTTLSDYYASRGNGTAPTDAITRAWDALWTARWGSR
jgi:hypothetical protein